MSSLLSTPSSSCSRQPNVKRTRKSSSSNSSSSRPLMGLGLVAAAAAAWCGVASSTTIAAAAADPQKTTSTSNQRMYIDMVHGDPQLYNEEQNQNQDHGAPNSLTTARLLAKQLDETDLSTIYEQSWADGVNTEWDEYQQAWRLLGFLVDCEKMASHWHDDDDGNGGSGSGDYQYSANGCRRYVLWAAYVDPNYQGDGIGEYQFWDRSNKKWNKTPCSYVDGGNNNDDGGSRCAKMDCHAADTSWQLLGIFKHHQPDEWMEQLFKHEGVCVWNKNEYSFMKNARKAWPSGCVLAPNDATTMSGKPIYYAMKPVSGGSITMGLYSDDRCTQEYTGVNANVEGILGNYLANAEGSHDSGDDDDGIDYSQWSLKQAQSYWDSSLDAFKICQPCVAYDLNNVGYNGGEQGSSYGTYECEDNGDDGNGGGGCVEDDFDCYDDAGYTNVNQCMKFRAKTYMDPATMRDVMLAHRQGTLVKTLPLAGMEEPSAGFFRTTWKFLWSILYVGLVGMIFIQSIGYFRKARKNIEWPTFPLKEPLVFA